MVDFFHPSLVVLVGLLINISSCSSFVFPLASSFNNVQAGFCLGGSPVLSFEKSQHKLHMRETSQEEAKITKNAQNTMKHMVGNILLLDHLNINHEKGRHDLVKAFFFDTLKLIPDPRKKENFEKGRKTLWANGPSRTLRPITRAIIESWEN